MHCTYNFLSYVSDKPFGFLTNKAESETEVIHTLTYTHTHTHTHTRTLTTHTGKEGEYEGVVRRSELQHCIVTVT